MFLGVRDQGGEDINTEKESALELQKEECESCVVCRTKLNSSAPPKLLPCLHHVCKACITNNDDGNAKECPVCGLSFNLSEVTDCYMFVDSAPKCGGCDESVPSGWCVQCEEALCSQCVAAHQRVKMTRNHTVTPQDPSSGSTSSLRCASHKQEWLKFLCSTCDELTCRDCQLIQHRGHSFLLLEEAVVSLREQLQKMLHSIREQRNSMEESLLNMDGRLQDIKLLKVMSKKKVSDLVRTMYLCLVFRSRQLFKEVEGLYDEEEKNLLEMKTNLRKLEERQEYVTAFIHKILKTDSQCILLHKKQIEKQVEDLLSQRTCLNETVIRPTLQLSKQFCEIIKTFGSISIQRVPLESRRKHRSSSKSKETTREVDSGPSGINSEPSGLANVFGVAHPQSVSCSNTMAAADLPCYVESESASLKTAPLPQTLSSTLVASAPVLLEPPGESHASSSSVPVLHPQSTATQSVAAQVNSTLPPSAWSYSVSSQLPQSTQSFQIQSRPLLSVAHHVPTSSLGNQTDLSNIPSCPSQLGTTRTQAALALPQAGRVPSAVSLRLAPRHPTTTHRSISLHAASSQFPLKRSAPTQFIDLTQSRSHSAPSLSMPVSYSQPTNVKVPSNCRQDRFCLNQSAAFQPPSAPPPPPPPPPQSLQSNSHVPSAPSSRTLPFTQASSNTLLTHLRPSDVVVAQSHPLLFNLLKEPDNNTSCKSRGNWKFHYYTPVPAVNQATSVMSAPSCSLVLTTPLSGPGIAAASTSTDTKGLPVFGEMTTSWQSVLNSAACSVLPVDPKFTDLPVINHNEPTQTVSITPTLNASQTASVSSNQSQSELVTETTKTPKCEVPVKAPADSLGEGSVSMGGRASPADDDPDGNLPTSTVSEADPTLAAFSTFSSTFPDPPFIPTVHDCPSNQSSLSPSKMLVKSLSIPTPTEKAATSNPNSTGFPVSFRQVLEETASPTSQVDGEPPDDALLRSGTYRASSPSMKDEEEEAEEETDISDSEPVEEVYETIRSEGASKLSADTNKSLWVSLPRLPISLPASGSPLPQFRIVANVQTAEVLLKELQDGQTTERCFRIRELPEAISVLQSPSQECPLLDAVLDCNVCLSAGALLLCAECGRSFHSECHVPPVFKTSEFWICSLCHNVFDTDPFSQSRLKEPYLSIQDQRRCEQLLLTLMCEEHSYLLYMQTKHSQRCVDFEFIVGRLIGKRSPPYRSVAELVSDLWSLFDILFTSSKKRDKVIKLQRSFQERLNITFGQSLHASLLKPSSSDDQKGASETETDTKAKHTLKRMKVFFAANCDAKKPRAEGPNKD